MKKSVIALGFFYLINTYPLFAQTFLRNYSSHTESSGVISVVADSSVIRFSWYTNTIVRIDLLPTKSSIVDSSLVVIQRPDRRISIRMHESDSSLSISSSKMMILINKNPLRISMFDSSGTPLLSEPAGGGFATNGGKRLLQFSMDYRNHFYGTGERGNDLDKRMKKFVSYNTQVGGYSEPLATMNLNVPMFVTPNGFAMLIDNTYRGEFDFGASDSNLFTYTAEGGELTYYVIEASSIPEQLEQYTWLTGRQPLPPRWILGFTQSKNRYRSESEARSIVEMMRKKQFPCDAIVLDLAWFKNMGDISWDLDAWPNHEKMINQFLSDGIKTILITEPYIVEHSRHFQEASMKGYFAKDDKEKTFLLRDWWSCGFDCNAALLDLTNPDARRWWWNKHPSIFGKNVAGIWTDLGEPEKHPETMMHFMGSAVKIHNIYNLLWAQSIFDGFNQIKPNERVVNLTRSGFAGIQRYGALPWSGDVARSFGGLAVQLPMLLNMGMSGIAYHNSDIGGYARNPTTPELYVRWMQYGVFCPVTRTHGAGESVKGSPTEPWQFGEEAESISRKYLQLRYALLPYNYSLAFENYSSGIPFARPLFWMDPADPALSNESSSFMWGDAFLVSPIVAAGERKKEVYLPKGVWTNFWTDVKEQGGSSIIVDAPLHKMPIFVKAGSIIPMGPVMKYSNERELDTVTLHLYPDRSVPASAASLYEDDGKTLEYQQGKFALTTFSQSLQGEQGKNRLTISLSPSKGMFSGKLAARTYLMVVHHIQKKPAAVQVRNVAVKEARSASEVRSKNNAFYFDSAKNTLFLQLHARLDESYDVELSGLSIN